MARYMRAAALIFLCYGTAATSASSRSLNIRPAAGAANGASPDMKTAVELVSSLGTVSSTLRSREHNRAVGGAPRSHHLIGRASDVARYPGVKHSRIHAMLVAAGFKVTESLDEGDHSHFAFGERPIRVQARPDKPEAAPTLAAKAISSSGPLLADSAKGTLIVPIGTLVPGSGLVGRQ